MRKFFSWIAAGAIITAIFLTVYAVGQQVLRQTANDPQSYVAQQIASQLDAGAQPADVLGAATQLEASSAPFTGIYDLTGKLIITNGTYDHKELSIPFGVMQHATTTKPHEITWQPADNLRLASVSVKSKQYYVVTARSLKDTEHRIDMMGIIVLLGWLGSLIVLTGAYFLQHH